MNELILPGRDHALFDKRQEDEDTSAQRQKEFGERYTVGAPELPEAQIVFNANRGTFGVAVRGAKFVCELPKGYERQGCELGAIDGDRFIVTFPGKSALVIDPKTGSVRPY